MNSNGTLIEQLREDISDKSVKIIPLKTAGGSYGIKYLEKHRIASVQEMRKGGYKCTCDDEKSRRIFDKIKTEYERCPGFKYKSTSFRALYLDRQEDMRSFLLKVIHEYLLIVND
jgi:hypothetical protein